jgi:hypothetical protein
MAKFNKRISKVSGQPLQNALVIGKGFGFLTNILEIFQTVFLIDNSRPAIKARNLVFKEGSDELHLLVDVSMIFFDKDNINEINSYAPVFTRWKSIVIIEGDEPISRDFSQSLYHHGWKCTSQQGFFHVWEIK